MHSALERQPRIAWTVVAILLLAAAARLGYLWYYSSLPDWTQLTVDNNYHHHWAQRIAAGDIFGDTTYFRAPFYVYCLALLYSVFGDGLWVARLFGAAIGVTSVFFTFLIARRIFNHTVGLIAGAVQAVYPIMLYFDGELLLDPLFSLLLQAALYAFLTWFDRRTVKAALIVGLLLGLAAITRPTALIYLPPIMLGMWFCLRAPRRWLVQVAAVAVGAAMLVGPIFLRNIMVAGDPVLIASQSGINVYIGNNEDADGLSAIMPEPLGANWRIKDVTWLAERRSGAELTPGGVSNYWNAQGWRWISSHPWDALTLYLTKLNFSIANREISNNRDLPLFFERVPYLKHMPLPFAVAFVLGLGGIALGWRDRRVRILAFMIVLLLAANAVFFVNSRFRLPVMPILIVLSAFAVVQLIELIRFRPRALVIPIAVMTAGLVLSVFPLASFPRGVNVQGLVSKALYYYSEGDYGTAIALNQRAIELDPDFPDLNLNIGAAYFRLGVADSAEQHFRMEIQEHPARAKAYANLASLYMVNHKPAEAWEAVQQALALQPYNVMARLLEIRLSVADSSATLESMRPAITDAITQTDSNLQIVQEAAGALQAKGDLPAAESLLQRSLALSPPPIETDDAAFDKDFPNSPEGWVRQQARSRYLLGFLYGTSGRFAESIEQSRTAISMDSSLAEAYVNLVSGYLSVQAPDSADAVLREAQRRFPADQRIRRLASYRPSATK